VGGSGGGVGGRVGGPVAAARQAGALGQLLAPRPHGAPHRAQEEEALSWRSLRAPQ
jgi:hypothetical protein